MDKETSLELLTLFFNNTPDNVYVKDANSAFLLASKATVKLLKAEKFEDIEGKTD